MYSIEATSPSRHLLSALELLALGLSALLWSGALDINNDSKTEASSFSPSQKREKLIAKRISALGPKHPWAGNYYKGDGLGMNVSLSLAPGGGFTWSNHGCLGLYGASNGSVVEEGALLKLAPEEEDTRRETGPLLLRIVPWGSRTYLIEPNELRGFANAVNKGMEPRFDAHGLFLLRRGDEKKAGNGKPMLDPGTAALLLDEPIKAHVVFIDTPISKQTQFGVDTTVRIRVDAGRAEGVWGGMQFTTVKGYCSFKVSTLQDHASEGVATVYHLEEIPKLGAAVSTNFSDEPAVRHTAEPLIITTRARPGVPRFPSAKYSALLFDADLASAKKAGVPITAIADIEFAAEATGLFDFDLIYQRTHEAILRYGGNAEYSARSQRHGTNHPFVETVTIYEVGWPDWIPSDEDFSESKAGKSPYIDWKKLIARRPARAPTRSLLELPVTAPKSKTP